MKRLGRISRTFSAKVEDPVDHSQPRKLFKDIYRAYLPEINILTKTQKKQAVVRQNSAQIKKRAMREERMRRLQQPRMITTAATIVSSQHTSTTLSPKRRMSPSQSRHRSPQATDYSSNNNNNLLYIYKSEIKSVDEIGSTTNGRASIRKNRNSVETEQSAAGLDHPLFSKQLMPVRFSLPSRQSNQHAIEYQGDSSQLLVKIFDAGDYLQTFQQANRDLLKRQRVYRSRQWKLETKHDWRM